MEGVKNIEIDSEKIYLKKSKVFGWGVVYPWRNEDGSLNWFNLLTGGQWIKLISIIVIVIISIGYFWEYHKNLSFCAEVLSRVNITTNQVKLFNFTV